MTAATALPHPLSPAEWDVEWAHRDDAAELVEGIPTVAPPESLINRRVAFVLASILDSHLPPRWLVVTDGGVETVRHAGRHTVRVPDVVVLPRRGDLTRSRVLGTDVALLAEIVSPSSIEVDWIRKRREYASAGVPAYLVVDAGADGSREPRLTLFEDPADGDFRRESGGSAVTLSLASTAVHLTMDRLLEA